MRVSVFAGGVAEHKALGRQRRGLCWRLRLRPWRMSPQDCFSRWRLRPAQEAPSKPTSELVVADGEDDVPRNDVFVRLTVVLGAGLRQR